MKAVVLFNSLNKYSLYIVEYPTEDSHYCIFMKGAPEKIWSYSDKILIDGDEELITDEILTEYNAINRKFAKNSERVLGFAKYHLPKEEFPIGFQFRLKKHDTYNFDLD